MNKILLSCLLVGATLTSTAQPTNIKVSAMSPASVLDGTEKIMVTQSGGSKAATVSQIATNARAQFLGWNVAVFGDSIAAKENSVVGTNVCWPYPLTNQPALFGTTLYNYAASGQGIAYAISAIPGAMATLLPRFSGKHLAVIIEVGANDYPSFTNIAGANAYAAQLDGIAYNLHTNGVDKVYACTVMLRSNAVNYLVMLGNYQLNRLILNSTNFDGVADFASAFPDPASAVDFQDGLHLNIAASRRAAMLVASTMAGHASAPAAFQSPFNTQIYGGSVTADPLTGGNFTLTGNNINLGPGNNVISSDGSNLILNPPTAGGINIFNLNRGAGIPEPAVSGLECG